MEKNTYELLKQLKELFDNGAITSDEFENEKKLLLNINGENTTKSNESPAKSNAVDLTYDELFSEKKSNKKKLILLIGIAIVIIVAVWYGFGNTVGKSYPDIDFEKKLIIDLTNIFENKSSVKITRFELSKSSPYYSKNEKKFFIVDYDIYVNEKIFDKRGKIEYDNGKKIHKSGNMFEYNYSNGNWQLVSCAVNGGGVNDDWTDFGRFTDYINGGSKSNNELNIESKNGSTDLKEIDNKNLDAERLSSAEIPTGISYNGSYIDGLKWNDKNGKNYLIISALKQGTYGNDGYKSILFGCCFVDDGGSLKKLWEIKEDAVSVFADMEYVTGSLKVVDLDNDGIKENLFLYRKSTDGAGALPLKLIMHSGSKKYALRGEYCPEIEVCGNVNKYNADVEFNTANPTYKVFAVNEWNNAYKRLAH